MAKAAPTLALVSDFMQVPNSAHGSGNRSPWDKLTKTKETFDFKLSRSTERLCFSLEKNVSKVGNISRGIFVAEGKNCGCSNARYLSYLIISDQSMYSS
jgi:hypothetical protein